MRMMRDGQIILVSRVSYASKIGTPRADMQMPGESGLENSMRLIDKPREHCVIPRPFHARVTHSCSTQPTELEKLWDCYASACRLSCLMFLVAFGVGISPKVL